VALPPRWLSLVRDAIEIVLRRLSTLPPSPEVEELRARVEQYLRETDGWSASPPTVEEWEKMTKRVVGLHTAVAKLEKQGPGA